METLIPGIFVLLMVTMFILAISLGMRQSKRSRTNLQRLADELRLQAVLPEKRRFLPAGGGSITGDYRGRPVRIYAYTTGSGKNRTRWCAVEAQVSNPAELKFSISGENFFTRVGKTFGLSEVNVGDAQFDRQFFVRSNQPDYMKLALIPEVRSRFLAYRQAGVRGSIKAEDSTVKYAEVGSFSNDKIIARFPQALEAVCDAAEIVETCPA